MNKAFLLLNTAFAMVILDLRPHAVVKFEPKLVGVHNLWQEVTVYTARSFAFVYLTNDGNAIGLKICISDKLLFRIFYFQVNKYIQSFEGVVFAPSAEILSYIHATLLKITKWRQYFVQSPYIKFHQNPFTGSRVTGRQTYKHIRRS